jgi:hypothetical protein
MDDKDFLQELEEESSAELTLENLYSKSAQVKELERKYKIAKDELDGFRAMYMQKMKADGVTFQENRYISVCYKEPYETKQVDTEKMKADGIYDKYTITKSVSESILVKLKKING